MHGSAILSLAYRLVNKDSDTFLDGVEANIMEDLNRAYGHRILDILRVRVDKNASIKEVTTTLVSTSGLAIGDNGYNGEYAFPTDLLKPVRFEVSYDGITWNKATVYDNTLNNGSEYNDTQLANDFSESSPRVDFTRNSFKIRPPKTSTGNITNGIYIEYEVRSVDFSSSTAPVDIESTLQDILSWDLARLEITMHSSKYSSQEITVFNQEHEKIEKRFLTFYSTNLPTKKNMSFNFHSLPR